MNIRYSMLALASVIAAPAAFAQTTTPSQSQTPSTTMPQSGTPQSGMPQSGMPQTGTDQGTTPATPGAPMTAASVTDAEVKQYAAAALAVNRIREDASVPEADKNARFVEAIRASGLTALRFNEISQAMPDNPALNERIQKEAAAQQQASATAPGGAPGASTQSAATPSTPNPTN